MAKCSNCGGESLEEGAVYGPGRTSFRPAGTRFFTLESGDVMTKASMCRDCGRIDLTGDLKKLKRLTDTD